MNYFIGGSALGVVMDGKNKYFTTRTLLESSIDVTSSVEEAMGQNGVFVGLYYHSTRLKVTLSDQLFDLKYVAMNTGANVTLGGQATVSETVTLGAGGTGTITGTPVAYGNYGTVGWANIAGKDEDVQTITFTGKTFSFIGGEEGAQVCVEYYTEAPAMEVAHIPAIINPKIYTLILRANLYAGYGSEFSESTSTKVGEVVIVIPQFVLDGNQTISMSNTGISTTPLSGQAKAYASAGCTQDLQLATIATNLFDANWYDRTIGLSAIPASSTIAVGGTTPISVRGVTQGIAPYPVPMADLIFTSGAPATATVSNTGVITGVAVGKTNIVVTIKEKPSVLANVTVDVTA